VGDTSVAKIDSYASGAGIPFPAAIEKATQAGVNGKALGGLKDLLELMPKRAPRRRVEWRTRSKRVDQERLPRRARVGTFDRGARVGSKTCRSSSARPAISTSRSNAATSAVWPRSAASAWVPMRNADVDHPEGLARVQAFLEAISLVTDLDENDPEASSVTLMNAAFGQGARVSGRVPHRFEDGVFPHVRSLGDPDELEEERRLCYGRHHARRATLVLVPRVEPHDVRLDRLPAASRFLDEIPAELGCRSATRKSAGKGSGASRFGRCAGCVARPRPPTRRPSSPSPMVRTVPIRSVCARRRRHHERFGEGDRQSKSGDKAEAIRSFPRTAGEKRLCSYGPRSRV